MSKEDGGDSPIHVTRAGDYERTRYHRMCVIGLSGSGKTVLGTTAPKPLALVAEKIALPTIRSWNPDQGIIEIRNRDHLWDVLRWCYSSEEARQYETLVVDSATECGDMIKKWISENSPEAQKLRAKGMPEGTISLSDWGAYYAELDRFMRALTTMPMHTLALAQAFEIVDDLSKQRLLRPNFEGSKFPPRFPGYFSLSGAIECFPKMQGEGVDRRVMFEAAGGLFLVKGAKGLGAIEEPNVTRWIEKMDAAAAEEDKERKGK